MKKLKVRMLTKAERDGRQVRHDVRRIFGTHGAWRSNKFINWNLIPSAPLQGKIVAAEVPKRGWFLNFFW